MSAQLTKLTARQKRRNLRSVDASTAAMVSGTEVTSQFRPLTGIQVEKIHQAALDLLEQLGMANPTPRVLDIALANGCSLNAQGAACLSATACRRYAGRSRPRIYRSWPIAKIRF